VLAPTPDPSSSLDHLHEAFLILLPRIRLHAEIVFRHVRCRARRDDCVAETIALAWTRFVGLADRGKDAGQFASVFAARTALAVKNGRRLCGAERSRDALSPVAQARHGFTLSPLPRCGSREGSVFDEALVDNTMTPPDAQAAFRIDFSAWRFRRRERDRHLIDDLMSGERVLAVARRHGLSPARVSQLRREFRDDWLRFTGEGKSDPEPTTSVA
jgi:hypothetical protein